MQFTREAKDVALYPQGRFVEEFARRTLANVRDVRYGRVIEWQDTALVSFLLAVFVLPHERVDVSRSPCRPPIEASAGRRSAPDRLVPPHAGAATVLVPIDPPWDQRLAHVLMRPLIATPITPNQITTVSLAIGLVAALLFAQGGWAVHLGAACFVLSFWLDHADGEFARMTGRTSLFGHYYDLAAGGAVLIALFLGMGIGARDGALGAWSLGLGIVAGLATALIFVARLHLERRAGKTAVRQPNLLGFEIEDLMYLVGPITWLGFLEPFLVLAGIGAPIFALFVLWESRRLRAGLPK